MKDNNFIIIKGWMRTRLKLKGNELFLYAIVYGYSQDGMSRCKSSLTYIQEALGVSRNTAIMTRNRLIEKELIFKHKDGYEYSANIELVQKLNQPSAETELVASSETEPNIYNNKYTNKDINVLFEEIWNLYNFKRGKKKAQDKFISIIKKEKDPEDLVKKIKNSIPGYLDHLKEETWKQQQQLEFWLNASRWEDSYETKKSGKQSNIIHTQSDKYKNLTVSRS